MASRRHREHWLNRDFAGVPGWGLVLSALILAGIGGLTWWSSVRPDPTPMWTPVAQESPAPEPSDTAAPVRVAIIGDSLTAANSDDFPRGDIGDVSWAYYAIGDGVTFVGGYAEAGAPTTALAPKAPRPDADALIIAAGTNDVGTGVSFDATTAALERMAASVNARRVIVLSTPPRADELTPTTTDFNAELEALAASEGWEYVDSASTVRTDTGWADGMTADGIHYTQEAAIRVGKYVHDYLTTD